MLATEYKALSSKKGAPYPPRSKEKSPDKPYIWEGYILKLGVWLRKAYVWIGIKNNIKGVTLNWILIILEKYLDSDRNPTEGNSFNGESWLVWLGDTDPEKVRTRAEIKNMEGTK